ncbi:MAG: MFS transporter [Chitinophagales bacterium]
MLEKIIAPYRKIENHIYWLIAAQFFLQLINGSFFILFNYYMLDKGFQDFEIASIVEKRFLAVMLFAFPLGLFIKGRNLKPLFYLAAFGMPTFALLTIFGAESDMLWLLKLGIFGVGLSFIFMQATALPFVLLNAKKETHTESIALLFQTWVSGIIAIGILYFVLNKIDAVLFSERNIMIACACLAYVGVFFISQIKIKENVSTKFPLKNIAKAYDWGIIVKAVIPTMIIAIGAGFTIPFISLFFEKVHGVSSDEFALMSSSTYILVFFGMMIIPIVKRRFGYKIAITLVQALSIVALVLMATTEWYAHLPWAIGVAIFFYIIRQPLMNVAGPMTSEMTMYYVGKKNQELISAINMSIWSGSWFFSSRIFAILREQEVGYATIFMITAIMYVLGVVWYNYLINQYHKKQKEEANA